MIGSIHTCGIAAIAYIAVGATPMCVPAAAEEPKTYENHSLVGVTVETDAQLAALLTSGATVLDCVPGVGAMTVLATADQLRDLQALGLPTKLLLETIEPGMQTRQVAAVREDPFEDFFLDYHVYGDAETSGSIVWYLGELTRRHPDLASLIDVGTTLEDRTIWGIRISQDTIADKPGLVAFAGEHAREWITTTVPTFLATHLLENYGTDAAVTDLVDRVEFYLIPVFNVDGYVYSGNFDRFWRKNRRPNGNGTFGVDLNRNWAEGWGGPGSSSTTSSELYRGPSAFSEPETQALRDFFLAHPNVRAQLDLHSFGQLILWPNGYTSALCPDDETYRELGQTMRTAIYDVHGRHYRPGPVYTGIYPAAGVSVDWTYSELDILSYIFELRPRTGGLNWFDLPAEHIIPNNEEMLPAMLHLAGADWMHGAMRYRFPMDLPTTVWPGLDSTLAVDIVGQRESVVPEDAYFHYRYDPSGPFIDIPMTPMGDDRYQAILPATNCMSVPEFYFSATGDGGTHRTSPPGAPRNDVYTASVTTEPLTIFSEPLNLDPNWSREGQWRWGIPLGYGGLEGGGPDPALGRSNAFLYGYNLSGDYENSLPERHLTTPPIDCTGRQDVHLTFWRWLGVDRPEYDHASVRVSRNANDWVTVWENSTAIADTGWVFQDLDISAVADGQPAVFVRWTMGPTDGTWRYCGWNIDDIQLTGRRCEGLLGDYDGNGTVDEADQISLEACHTGPAGPVPPGCMVFDFDGDDDVDCQDWLAFQAAWSGMADPPLHEICDAFTSPTPDPFERNRYLQFQAGGSMRMPQAFRVVTLSNPLFPETVGQQKWVGPPDDDGLSRLECFRTYRDWRFAMVQLADQDIVPGARYAIEATINGAEFLEPTPLATVSVWGDVAGTFDNGKWTPPDGIVDMRDATAQIDAYQHMPFAPPLSWADTAPETPDGRITILDIVYVVQAFGSGSYPYAAADDCP